MTAWCCWSVRCMSMFWVSWSHGVWLNKTSVSASSTSLQAVTRTWHRWNICSLWKTHISYDLLHVISQHFMKSMSSASYIPVFDASCWYEEHCGSLVQIYFKGVAGWEVWKPSPSSYNQSDLWNLTNLSLWVLPNFYGFTLYLHLKMHACLVPQATPVFF